VSKLFDGPYVPQEAITGALGSEDGGWYLQLWQQPLHAG